MSNENKPADRSMRAAIKIDSAAYCVRNMEGDWRPGHDLSAFGNFAKYILEALLDINQRLSTLEKKYHSERE